MLCTAHREPGGDHANPYSVARERCASFRGVWSVCCCSRGRAAVPYLRQHRNGMVSISLVPLEPPGSAPAHLASRLPGAPRPIKHLQPSLIQPQVHSVPNSFLLSPRPLKTSKIAPAARPGGTQEQSLPLQWATIMCLPTPG